MPEYKRFRTSLGGFNRQDVADYIEQTSREYREKLKACEKELNALKNERAEVERRREALDAKVQRLHDLFAELEETFRKIDEEKGT